MVQFIAADVQNEHIELQAKTGRLHTTPTLETAWTLCMCQEMTALQSVLSPCGDIL